jgi:hypothetical protein
MAQSENLLPFVLGQHCAPIAIPAERGADGVWQILDESTIRGRGLTHTARRFRDINKKLKRVGQGKSLQQRIDERGKLAKQVFGSAGYLIVAGAGGKHICAACIPVAKAQNLIIDQTLYWKVIMSKKEAWFFVGMLNSHAMTEAIAPFNPKGGFGERHVHALPYRLMPAFDPSNEDHLKIAELARGLTAITNSILAADKYLTDPNHSLTHRRMKVRALLLGKKQMQQLEMMCSAALGTTAVAQDAKQLEAAAQRSARPQRRNRRAIARRKRN